MKMWYLVKDNIPLMTTMEAVARYHMEHLGYREVTREEHNRVVAAVADSFAIEQRVIERARARGGEVGC